jgi:hypothetical protein
MKIFKNKFKKYINYFDLFLDLQLESLSSDSHTNFFLSFALHSVGTGHLDLDFSIGILIYYYIRFFLQT